MNTMFFKEKIKNQVHIFLCIQKFLVTLAARTEPKIIPKPANKLVKPLGFVREYPLFKQCQKQNILYNLGAIGNNVVSELPDNNKYEMFYNG